MKGEYDLSTMKSRTNPYASQLKKPVTMRPSEDVVDYFKRMEEEASIPYQSLINLNLRYCVMQRRKIHVDWEGGAFVIPRQKTERKKCILTNLLRQSRGRRGWV